jgi:hypothetical protein
VGWFDYINSAGIIGALILGALQTRKLGKEARARDADRRIERALEFYRDLVVDGDTANAFHRLSVMLRHKGTKVFRRTTWFVMTDQEFEAGGLLDPSATGINTPFEDFYRVIWYFERVDNALQFGLVNPDVFFRTVGFHCWWWGHLLGQIKSPKAIRSLHQLGPRAAEWAQREQLFETWWSHCVTDFNGGPPIRLNGL